MHKQHGFDDYYRLVEENLLKKLTPEHYPHPGVVEAMRYSLSIGGKRIRPVLLLAFCEACGGNASDALDFALAIEYIHTYSLIHDDLPCMDNADLRRGQPSNHKKFGETTAVLAGDALLNFAFETMLSSHVEANKAVLASRIISEASGIGGMIGGQALDTLSQSEMTRIKLEQLDRLKTGALLRASGEAGCVLGGGNTAQTDAASRYCADIGLAFQIRDDMLDIISSDHELGKPVGSDRARAKTTYTDLLGLDGCEREIERLTISAISHLRVFSDVGFFEKLAQDLAGRVK